ncbi:MAG: SH3 domain-containing protein [archaeon]|nr:SH3 domain-containing protein [archaeon]
MTLKKCKECSNKISKKATKCPNCGSPQKKQYGCGTLLLIVFGIGFIGSLFNSNDVPKKQTSLQKTQIEKIVASPMTQVSTCGDREVETGKIYKISGSRINIRKGPGINFDKIINKKATEILKTTQYITVDNTVTVFEECTKNGWSKIRVTEPEWLRKSHRGWIASKFIRKKQTDNTGSEIFTENDFMWDKNITPYKKIIIAGVNKVHRENSRCKNIDPSSAYISGSKGTKYNPVFFVTCGKGKNTFNAFFSKSEIEKNTKLTEKKHIEQSKAIGLCEQYAKQHANHPSTVKFSKIMDLAVTEHPNGRTRVNSTFTAKNSFNLEVKFKISCLLDENGIIDANIIESD